MSATNSPTTPAPTPTQTPPYTIDYGSDTGASGLPADAGTSYTATDTGAADWGMDGVASEKAASTAPYNDILRPLKQQALDSLNQYGPTDETRELFRQYFDTAEVVINGP